MTEKAKNKGGRPTKYKPEYEEQAYKLCLLGATDKDLADFFGVTEDCITKWKKKHPKFLLSLKEAKAFADAKVVKSLYQRATGYDHPDIHFSSYEGKVTETLYIKHFIPDVAAQIFWLKNRDKENWRDKHEHEVGGKDGKPIPISIVDFSKIDDSTQ